MNKHLYSAAAIVIGLMLLGASCGAKTSTTNTPKQKFSGSSDYQYAYLISVPTLSAQAETAITGFDLSKLDQADGSTVYELKAKKSGYFDQKYTVKPGESLYFIESSLNDDNGDVDERLNDDTAVVVDANGYVVNS